MNKHEFTLRYNLHRLGSIIPSAPPSYLGRKAAVLIPVIEIEQQLHLILTRRPMHLRHHPGQISFPGGKVEPDDINAIHTALREAHEEIGLLSENVDVLGVFRSNRHKIFHYRHGEHYQVHFMPFEDKFIWGVTAAIIDLLCHHIEDN